MTKIYIVSGFLGSGKTTYINTLIPSIEGKTALIENEFGEINVDSNLVNGEAKITEISDGCICCTLATDFGNAIKKLCVENQVDNIIIEPSGVALLSEVIRACEISAKYDNLDIKIAKKVVVVDANSYFEFKDEFPFYDEQICNADEVVLTHKDLISENELENVKESIRKCNKHYDNTNVNTNDIIKEIFESISIENAVGKNLKSIQELLDSIDLLCKSKNIKIYRIKGYININNKKYLLNTNLSSSNIEEKEGSGLVIIGQNMKQEYFEQIIGGIYLN